MSSRILSAVALVSAITLAACTADITSPASAPTRLPMPSALLSPGEGVRIITDSVDAFGNTILVQELGMGIYTLANGESGTAASVTIKSLISGNTTSSKACITSSIVGTDAISGIKLTVKKSGGCNKDIEILIEQSSTGMKATFKFSMVPGKTVIDSGLLR